MILRKLTSVFRRKDQKIKRQSSSMPPKKKPPRENSHSLAHIHNPKAAHHHTTHVNDSTASLPLLFPRAYGGENGQGEGGFNGGVG
jgi:hypothetical protein